MVNVISKGREHIKKVTCKNCSSVLEYAEAEVKRIDGTDMGGGPDGCTYIECPTCSKRVQLTIW